MARKPGLSVGVFINESIITFRIGYSGESDIMGVVFSTHLGQMFHPAIGVGPEDFVSDMWEWRLMMILG